MPPPDRRGIGRFQDLATCPSLAGAFVASTGRYRASEGYLWQVFASTGSVTILSWVRAFVLLACTPAAVECGTDEFGQFASFPHSMADLSRRLRNLLAFLWLRWASENIPFTHIVVIGYALNAWIASISMEQRRLAAGRRRLVDIVRPDSYRLESGSRVVPWEDDVRRKPLRKNQRVLAHPTILWNTPPIACIITDATGDTLWVWPTHIIGITCFILSTGRVVHTGLDAFTLVISEFIILAFVLWALDVGPCTHARVIAHTAGWGRSGQSRTGRAPAAGAHRIFICPPAAG